MSCLTPTSLSDALAVLGSDPEATVLAGGTDLMVEINVGHRRPGSVVVVNRVPELRSWTHDPGGNPAASTGTVRLGAG